MSLFRTDFVILGTGFAGSLLALILRRLGRDVVIVDRARHPRFAIGESSTPVGNMVLRDLAVRYDLPQLAPLAKYGPWKRVYPQLVCGRKRGFSYFRHERDTDFTCLPQHANELLVAASSDEEHSDTHWLRADVDAFLAREAQAAGAVLLEATELEQADLRERASPAWQLRGRDAGEKVEITANFVIDGSGESCLVARWLEIPSCLDSMHTHSRAVFAHFTGLEDFQRLLRQRGARLEDHPFPCDDAAQHHVFDGGWMWVLRFDQGLTSAGFCLDPRRYPLELSCTPDEEWRAWLARYPALAAMFADSRIADPPGRIMRTGRMQRHLARAAGPHWALLPHAAGFIDPLHSSGIAHSLCGVERLARIFEQGRDGQACDEALPAYDQIVRDELRMIDLLVASCYATLAYFPAFAACSMLYFAAATTYERRRATRSTAPGTFLEACDVAWQRTVADIHRRAETLGGSGPATPDEVCEFVNYVAEKIRPWNQVGLFNDAALNMYRHTVAPM